MIQLSRWKVIAVALAFVLGVLFALPNVLPASVRAQMPGWLPSNTLNLGLDLQGGSYLLLEVDTEALRREKLTNLTEDVRTQLREDGVGFSNLTRTENGASLRVNDAAQVDAAVRTLNTLATPSPTTGAPDLTVQRGPDQTLRVVMSDDALNAQAVAAVSESVEVIRRRIDELGTREPSITRQGTNRIVVQAPGESDPERLKNVIGQTAKLSFHPVDEAYPVQDALAGRVPPDAMLVMGDDGTPYVVKRRSIVTGEMLTNAAITYDQNNQPAVAIRFNGEGARRFGAYTTNNVGRTFAIVLDDKVISAANIIEPIPSGNGQITGVGGLERASDLVVLLNAGALPAPLTVEEQRTVGAELGADAVAAGKVSTVVAFLCVLLFMILAYGFVFGGISVIALLVNGLLIFAAMSLTQATLTLPGIAGLILTLAMAVDANVLIYERIRDEARAGRSLIGSLDAGFQRAMVTILDANLTTILAALIMFYFGAGPVRGFAWTLSIGVVTSVFTAVLITQILLAVWVRVVRPKKLPIA